MAKQYKNYDEEFKKTIVNLYESGKSIADLSREYGVGHTNYQYLNNDLPPANQIYLINHNCNYHPSLYYNPQIILYYYLKD